MQKFYLVGANKAYRLDALNLAVQDEDFKAPLQEVAFDTTAQINEFWRVTTWKSSGEKGADGVVVKPAEQFFVREVAEIEEKAAEGLVSLKKYQVIPFRERKPREDRKAA